MYPYLRYRLAMARARRLPGLGLFDAHVSEHRCLPGDIDPWMELNNGRILTLYDLGRVPMAMRMGLSDAMRKNGLGMVVAGSAVRYRQRVVAFERFTMVSRLLGWDHRFLYIEQSMWKAGSCTNHVVLRQAVTRRGAKGMVNPQELLQLLAPGAESPALPDWITAWVAAENARPWPPYGAELLAP